MSVTDSDLFSILDTVDSTNNYAMGHIRQGLARDGSCWFAREQTEGRGQRGKQWKSEKGLNIAMSMMIKPPQVFQQNPFVLNALIAVSALSIIKEYSWDKQFCIKWPNDIYWNDKKTAGILIENKYVSMNWNWCVVGIGVNVNQQKFPANLPHATSLKLINETDFDPLKIARRIHAQIMDRVHNFKAEDVDALMQEYNSSLYQQGKWVKFKKDSRVFESKVIRVDRYGDLITEDKMERQFHFSELQWVMESE